MCVSLFIVKVIFLEDATPVHLSSLSTIGSKEEVYKNLGVGKPWGLERFQQLYRDSVSDSKKFPHPRDYYHYVIIFKNNAVGYVSIRPTERVQNEAGFSGLYIQCIILYVLYIYIFITAININLAVIYFIYRSNIYIIIGPQLRYFVDPEQNGRGIATLGVSSALVEYTKFIEDKNNKSMWAFITGNNKGSIKLVENKLGFKFKGTCKLNKETNLYAYCKELKSSS